MIESVQRERKSLLMPVTLYLTFIRLSHRLRRRRRRTKSEQITITVRLEQKALRCVSSPKSDFVEVCSGQPPTTTKKSDFALLFKFFRSLLRRRFFPEGEGKWAFRKWFDSRLGGGLRPAKSWPKMPFPVNDNDFDGKWIISLCAQNISFGKLWAEGKK